MSDAVELMTRREVVRRVAYLLGGAISAPTVAGVLAGCYANRNPAEGAVWLPRTLSQEQGEMVLIMGEHILPETDTPGARAARVHEYIDAMLSDYYPADSREGFLGGLGRVNTYALRAFGNRFLELSPVQQHDLSLALNRQAFRDRQQRPEAQPNEVSVLDESHAATENERVLPHPEGGWDLEDVGRGSFFRTLKELVLVGYYTSELGATQELTVNPMGSWRPDIPYSEVGHTWA